jgi:hypothetical protein
MEVRTMRIYNITRHVTTILTVFAALFFLAGAYL